MQNLKNPDHLSEIEIKVMLATCKGLSNSEIARKFSKNDRMIDHCLKNLYDKFYVRNKKELTEVASRLFRLNFNEGHFKRLA